MKQMDPGASARQGTQGEREFRVEVDILSRLNHPNLVRLIGYCADRTHRLLVYEYMVNGNLQELLHGKERPDAHEHGQCYQESFEGFQSKFEVLAVP